MLAWRNAVKPWGGVERLTRTPEHETLDGSGSQFRFARVSASSANTIPAGAAIDP
jgi:hypothetical protein